MQNVPNPNNTPETAGDGRLDADGVPTAPDVNVDGQQTFSGDDSASQETGLSTGVQAAAAGKDRIDVRDALIKLGLVSAHEWFEASEQIEADAALGSFLFKLRSIQLQKIAAGQRNIPALTEFQINHLVCNNISAICLGHYLLRTRLSANPVSETYLAWNLNLGRTEVLKTIRLEDLEPEQREGQKFLHEVEKLAQFNHRSITTIYHVGEDRGVVYIATEHVEGTNLETVVEQASERGKYFAIWWAAARMAAIAEALQYAHERGVCHRHLTPDKIIVDRNNNIKILGLGLAEVMDRQGATTYAKGPAKSDSIEGMAVVAPEQWLDRRTASAATDLYSLGCLFFYMLTGSMPFTAEDEAQMRDAHLYAKPPRVTDLRPDLPAGVNVVVDKLLAKDARQRYQSCGELIKALALWSSQTTEAASTFEPIVRVGVVSVVGGALLAALILSVHTAIQSSVGAGRGGAQFKLVPPKKPKTSVVKAEPVRTTRQKAPTNTRPRQQTVDFSLADFQRFNSDVWPDLRSLKEFVESLEGGNVRKRVSDETWRRRAVKWFDRHRQEHREAWTDDEQSKGATSSITQVVDPGTFDAFTEFVRKTTKKKYQSNGAAWLDEHVTALRWPDRNKWHDRFAVKLGSVENQPTLNRFKLDVEKLTELLNNPFREIRHTSRGSRDVATALYYYEQLSRLDPNGETDGGIEVQFEQDGKPIRAASIQGKVTVKVRLKMAGYLTIFGVLADGQQVFLIRTTRLDGNDREARPIVKLEASKPGTDQFWVYVTDADLWETCPGRLISDDGTQLNGGLIGFKLSPDDQLAQLEAEFPDPYVYERVMDHLSRGAVYPMLQRNSRVVRWSRQRATIRWK